MATLTSQGNEIIVDTPESAEKKGFRQTPSAAITSWVTGTVNPWEDFRNNGYANRWKQYWRLWRGQWSEAEKNRQSERSRLIAPALAQAIESTVSEIEEGLFSKDVWFDIVDNVGDEDKVDAYLARDLLREDLDMVNAKDAIAEAVLNAAIFGSGIVKVNTEVRTNEKPVRNAQTQRMERDSGERVMVTIDSIRPDEFIPDPAAKTIQGMLGCAIRQVRPFHMVLEKIEQGVYREDALPALQPGGLITNKGDQADFETEPQVNTETTTNTKINILEYHGKVPLNLLNGLLENRTPLDEVLEFDIANNPDDGDGPLVEAIVTIANDSTLLRAMVNPFTMTDRSIIAFQFEKVPGRFWGRGVAEKGLNPQKALDAEMRSRIDALGFVSSPMLGVDSGRLPRGFKMEIKPGKVWLTNGPPRDILQPIGIGDIQPATFNQTSEMERMVQMGTGAFDTASALSKQSSQSGASSATSNSLMMGAFVKRSKRAIRNVDTNLLQPMLKKAMWRYMQFDPRRYPKDFDFLVKATLGIVAREVEAMQLTQLLGMMPQGFEQVSMAIVQGIVENSSVANKAEITQAIIQALQPPSEEEQARQKEIAELQFEQFKAEATQSLLDNQKTLSEIRKNLADAAANTAKARDNGIKTEQEDRRIALQAQEIKQFEEQNEIAEKRLELQEKQVDARIAQMRNSSNG